MNNQQIYTISECNMRTVPLNPLPPIFILRFRSCIYEFIRVKNVLVGRTMVTQQLWEEVMGNNPSDYIGNNIPVNNISVGDINGFIGKLNALTSGHCGYILNYRLLEETEWEEIAGDSLSAFGDSETVINAASSEGFASISVWGVENSSNKPRQVSQTPPNEYGLYDMYGNLWEICTFRKENYKIESHKKNGPNRSDFADDLAYRNAVLAYKRAELKRKLLCRAKDETLFYVLKGGAWNIPQSGCNKQTRMEIEYNDRFSNAGFRICVSVGKIE